MNFKNVLLLLFISAALPAQEYAWQIIFADDNLLSDVSLQNVAGDSLVILHAGQKRRIAIDAIVEIRRAGTSKYWQGAGIGLLVGGATGALIAAGSIPLSGK